MMGSGFRIGRLAGINIRVDWSWILILVLITWNLSTSSRQIHPDWGPGLGLGLSLLAALLFFASVLAHEMAHSLVARAQGLPVRNITLFLFGGVSNIQREPKTPKDEFWVAFSGPLVSLIIGLLLMGVTLLSLIQSGGFSAPGLMNRLSPAATILLWLGSVNLILAIFNLIPGFPLDGGRVLRSIFWAVTHNARRATRWAALIGQMIAWVMIITGVSMIFGVRIPFFGTGMLNGIWLAFIGWYLNNASSQSSRHVAIQDILDGIPVTNLMRADPPTVEPDCTVNDLVHAHVMSSDDQAFPVLKDKQLVGIVTFDDVRRAPKDAWNTTLVGDIMTPNSRLVTVSPDEDAAAALEKLINQDVRQLPVVRGAEFLGLLRRNDIMHWLKLNSETASGGSRPGR